ncbi:DUF305 domain-containing protein [Streptomyces specialis]|uniref:DUF305 domain-containing protein n=1 Tax=Streptomyces specialis TaxID=498367 RepID=UPI00073E6B72|nr:DUF305 domain-containing protein [Streptomyces specialis]
MTRTTTRSVAFALAALTLAACGGGDTDGTTHNAADVTFAQAMIPHHQQAVEMAELALDRASSEDVRALAEQIRAAQAPEIATLTDWLDTWDEDTAPAATEDHAGHTMPGLGELNDATGPAFDTAFLELMIEHHRGAVEMARTERTEGAYEPATSMAESIITSQTAEIDRMTTLLPPD